ncbi:unnamed protein product [Rotaria sp. Silwood1]|nr:unnamed protein product [Rotaria sp. Silwood1]
MNEKRASIRMTMLDERYFSDTDLQERHQKLDQDIKNLDLSMLEISEEDIYDEWCDPKMPRIVRFEEVAAAAYRIKYGVPKTPCTSSHVSKLAGMSLYFKKDFLLHTGSFKERGARNTLMILPPEEKARGVIAASAGNHALAVCYHGQQLGIPVVVVMPRHAPIMKINNCKSFGAVVLVKGIDLAESKRLALKLAKVFGLRYINGFDHPHILAGQGSLGLEVLDQVPDVDAIIVPTGGGGLLAGVAAAVKAVNPRVQIISAESERAPGFKAAMKAGRPVFTECHSTLADGLAVSLNCIVFIIVIILAVNIQFLIGLPLIDGDDNYNNERLKRSDESLLPNGNFSLVTNEKLLKLQELANVVQDSKLQDLYRAVNHYVQMAKKNNEYVLWKYDANQEGLVLVLKQNLNGILYYG